MKHILLITLTIITIHLYSLSLDDVNFCLDREQLDILNKYLNVNDHNAIINSLDKDWQNAYLRYAQAIKDTALINNISNVLNNNIAPEDQMEFDAKEMIDNIGIERNDSLALAMIQDFYYQYPQSKWIPTAKYLQLLHLYYLSDYHEMNSLIDKLIQEDNNNVYITIGFIINPKYRRYINENELPSIIWDNLIDKLMSCAASLDNPSYLDVFDNLTQEQYRARIHFATVKVLYYQLLDSCNLFSDEDNLQGIIKVSDHRLLNMLNTLSQVKFSDNDKGEQAGYYYWKGKILSLADERQYFNDAAKCFIQCLILGAPRKRYDNDALTYLTHIHDILEVKNDLMSWIRDVEGYHDIIFQDVTMKANLTQNHSSRVALADYDNDGWCDILLNGHELYHNIIAENDSMYFIDKSLSAGLDHLNSSGGLFADFNKDGKIDFMTISNGENGDGERLMKNMGEGRFASVNDRAGDIDDRYPTEGAAWVDIYNNGYPSIYCANYEKWGIQSGYKDKFWLNDKGYFFDKSEILGFYEPEYTYNPAQAGRGVAPADFDNDGDQEVYVCNYRLNRNFCWDYQKDHFRDIAPINFLQGKNKQGYYGHSIGADWGDFDNDGDLDLFVANLAHPRYIDISDISMLLRNDGLQYRVIEQDTVYYWKFTDITKQAGITYDELHSDPLWFDADNDGFLDLFITSVYENDRSYLYHNNGNGTFSDITFLSGVRVYNGWGNATGDLNNDGLLDLVVGSGNGVKVFINKTITTNKSMLISPIWINNEIEIINKENSSKLPYNSPAFGTRVKLTMQSSEGSIYTLIRELSSAKGTTSQNQPILHFGLGENKLIDISRVIYDKN